MSVRLNDEGQRNLFRNAYSMDLFDVTRPHLARDAEGYCPYCNLLCPNQLTEEHVIPQCIGGSDNTTIWVCKKCNNYMGSKVDTLLMRHAFLRSRALCYGTLIGHLERQPTTATLRNGRTLDGYFHWKITNEGIRPGFTPLKIQPDGTTWLSEKAIDNTAVLPPHINVYKDEMLEMVGLVFEHPSKLQMEPAIVKIVLGAAYLFYGRTVVSTPTFDPLREAIKTLTIGSMIVQWMNSLDELNAFTGFGIGVKEDAIWIDSNYGKKLRGGVAFGCNGISALIENRSYGQRLEGRILRVILPF